MQDDIFAHLFQQNEAQTAPWISALRMYVNLQLRGQAIKGLVDTWSTVSTATEAVIKNLKIRWRKQPH